METKIAAILRSNRTVRRFVKTRLEKSPEGWMAIDSTGELHFYEKAPRCAVDQWILNGGSFDRVCWLKTLCASYGQQGRYGPSTMRRDFMRWSWPLSEVAAAVFPPRQMAGGRQVKRVLAPLLRETVDLEDYWL